MRLYGKDVVAPNRIEWRSPRFVNFAPVGRYATKEQRAAYDMSWRDDTAEILARLYPEADVFKGGSVSIDICSKGADKSRAGIVLGKMWNEQIVFVGDKTSKGGNDYPLCQWIENDGKSHDCWLTSTGVQNTIEIVDEILERLA